MFAMDLLLRNMFIDLAIRWFRERVEFHEKCIANAPNPEVVEGAKWSLGRLFDQAPPGPMYVSRPNCALNFLTRTL